MTDAAFTFGDVRDTPSRSGGDDARMRERRELAALLIGKAAAALENEKDGRELPINLGAKELKRHTPAQVSRAINDALNGGYAGPIYARAEKDGPLYVVKGKRTKRANPKRKTAKK